MSSGTRKKLGSIVHHTGVTFRVWAPMAKSVGVLVPYISYDTEHAIEMSPEKGGYWVVTVPEAEAGQTYKYKIRTGSDEYVLRNDPRARSLTSSDNGASVIAADDFDWGDDLYMPRPKNEHIIYELHIGTFHRADASTQGTFYDAIEKLDYLAELGITMIELMPVTSMAESHGWGYNTNSMFAIENSYGGRRGLMTFVRECHERGIGVIADVVYNHFANADIWQFDGWSENGKGGIYFYNDERGDTPWGARPDYGRKEVRQCILDSVKMWFEEFRLDGLRLDSTSYMRNLEGGDNQAKDIADAWTLLQDMTDVAHRVRPGSLVIAEDSSSNDFIVKQRAQGGAGFDAQWRLTFPEALYQAIGIPARYHADIKYEITQKYTDDPFTRVVFSDSHDTAANGRARLNEVAMPKHGEGVRAQQELLLANTVVCTSAGIPMLLQGQEFMQDGTFNEWEELDWENRQTYDGIVAAHRELIALRRNTYQTSKGLLGANTSLFHVNDQDRVLAYHRWHEGGVGDDVIVVLNFGDSDFPSYDIALPIRGEWEIAFQSARREYYEASDSEPIPSVATNEQRVCTIGLPARSSIIFTRVS
jgi:1,4-alpha-glucan branching enzyme